MENETSAEIIMPDLNEQRFEFKSDENKIVFISGASANLLFHVLNRYNFMRNHSKSYADFESISEDTIDLGLADKLQKEDHFDKTIKTFVENKFQSPEEMISYFQTKEEWESALSDALQKSWDGFYKKFWFSNHDRLNHNFEQSVKSVNWDTKLKNMEDLTGKKLDNDFYLIGAEALAESAMMVYPNVSIGAIREDTSDFGFGHEGLHLLLREGWADDEEIKSFFEGKWYEKDGWGKHWRRKFEQAIVVSLESLIREYDEDRIKSYFKGCNVGDLKDIFYPPIKDWYLKRQKGEESRNVDEVIKDIIVAEEDRL